MERIVLLDVAQPLVIEDSVMERDCYEQYLALGQNHNSTVNLQ